MPRATFTHVETWVFDLDHTLYPPTVGLFDQIEARMSDWIMDALSVSRQEAAHLRVHYWQTYGTTLAGLMHEHGVDPGPFLGWVHDISFDALDPDPALRARITDLPGRRIVFTNGPSRYAAQVIDARGLGGLFDAVYSVEDAELLPKPQAEAFDIVFDKDGLDPTRSAMFEDTVANLEIPHQRGMRTVHVAPTADPADHIHHHTDDLTDFLSQLVGDEPDLGTKA
ncbi:MAG: pyrimidine 5'-nucleotidase [Pseudomonadota bacterium]